MSDATTSGSYVNTRLSERQCSRSFLIDSILSPDCTKASEEPAILREPLLQGVQSDDDSSTTDLGDSPTDTGKVHKASQLLVNNMVTMM